MAKGMPFRAGDSEKVAELAGPYEYGRASGEADHHGMGNEIDERAEARDPQRKLKYSGKEGEGDDHLDVVRAALS